MWWWARTGSHKGPFPTSTSSPAPTIHELGVAIRRIVGASGERMWWVVPCGRPSGVYLNGIVPCGRPGGQFNTFCNNSHPPAPKREGLFDGL